MLVTLVVMLSSTTAQFFFQFDFLVSRFEMVTANVTPPLWNVAYVQDNIQGIAVERVTFTEVTKKAVQEALQHPRQISQNLVESYKARRALDFLVGFGISPILWSKMVGSKSAGKEGGLRTQQ